jgi:hypothetical protein
MDLYVYGSHKTQTLKEAKKVPTANSLVFQLFDLLAVGCIAWIVSGTLATELKAYCLKSAPDA